MELERDFTANLPPPAWPRPKGSHFSDSARAIREGDEAGADFDYSAPHTEAVRLGTLAQRPGRPIIWDQAQMSALDVPEANPLLKPEIAPEWIVTL